MLLGVGEELTGQFEPDTTVGCQQIVSHFIAAYGSNGCTPSN